MNINKKYIEILISSFQNYVISLVKIRWDKTHNHTIIYCLVYTIFFLIELEIYKNFLSLITYLYNISRINLSNNTYLFHPKTISRNKTIIQEYNNILTNSFVQNKIKKAIEKFRINQTTNNNNINSITINIFKFITFLCSKFSKKYISTWKLFEFTLIIFPILFPRFSDSPKKFPQFTVSTIKSHERWDF